MSVQIELKSFAEFENVVRILMAKGANLNARDSNGDTALTLAVAEGKCLFWKTETHSVFYVRTQ